MQSEQQLLGDMVEKAEVDAAGCPIFWISKQNAIRALSLLKTNPEQEYCFLADLTAYDEKGSPEQKLSRFVMVYNLFSLTKKTRIRIKVRVQENESMPTAISVWAGANWAEREVFDLYGIRFEGHPDLRRILMDERWEGHPLRKDYPLRKSQIFNEPEQIPLHLLKE